MHKIHELRTLTPYFNEVVSGKKTFEIRKNDRGFHVGDFLLLKEWNPDTKYTGKSISVRVSYIFEGDWYGLDGEYCILAIKIPKSNNSTLYHLEYGNFLETVEKGEHESKDLYSYLVEHIGRDDTGYFMDSDGFYFLDHAMQRASNNAKKEISRLQKENLDLKEHIASGRALELAESDEDAKKSLGIIFSFALYCAKLIPDEYKHDAISFIEEAVKAWRLRPRHLKYIKKLRALLQDWRKIKEKKEREAVKQEGE